MSELPLRNLARRKLAVLAVAKSKSSKYRGGNVCVNHIKCCVLEPLNCYCQTFPVFICCILGVEILGTSALIAVMCGLSTVDVLFFVVCGTQCTLESLVEECCGECHLKHNHF